MEHIDKPVFPLASEVFTAIQAVWKMGTFPKTSVDRVIRALRYQEEHFAASWIEQHREHYQRIALGVVQVQVIQVQPKKLREPALPGSPGYDGYENRLAARNKSLSNLSQFTRLPRNSVR